LLDHKIPTEEHLTEKQIINMMWNKKNQVKESEDNSKNKEIPSILKKSN
jgi:hypothetical protein